MTENNYDDSPSKKKKTFHACPPLESHSHKSLSDNHALSMHKEDLRRCWKVTYIVSYCNLFEKKLDLIDLRVDEFEDPLLDDCGKKRNITIVHLLQKLSKPSPTDHKF
ncbi:hypothetical protein BpHYR1_018920 [Brachionus plicatilis]|uniref:Uncharacterized protein n=1 Tax=Brachionus plicatilis TaxID=10195 RepID=A0A3M7S6Z7_BRAPC|nr:hypothetical protein BpHYR1_018920 [Brachionus plicatilis]